MKAHVVVGPIHIPAVADDMREVRVESAFWSFVFKHLLAPFWRGQVVIHDELEYEVAQSREHLGEWRVEAIDYAGEGEIYLAIFSGPDAPRRAREYAAFKQEQADGS